MCVRAHVGCVCAHVKFTHVNEYSNVLKHFSHLQYIFSTLLIAHGLFLAFSLEIFRQKAWGNSTQQQQPMLCPIIGDMGGGVQNRGVWHVYINFTITKKKKKFSWGVHMSKKWHLFLVRRWVDYTIVHYWYSWFWMKEAR